MPGLAEWARVRDYRVQQIQSMVNVDIYLDSKMKGNDVLAVEADHIVIATGAHWKADGSGIFNQTSLTELGPSEQIFTPDDIMAGRLPQGPTMIFDDDHYYMASVIAERLREHQIPVTFVTPESVVSAWGKMTSEQKQIHRRLLDVGVDIITTHGLVAYNGSEAKIKCSYTGNIKLIAVEAVVTVTARIPNDDLFKELQHKTQTGVDNMPLSLTRIGDCEAPSIIAGAVFSGHRFAQELDTDIDLDKRIKYDRVFFEG